MATTESFFWLFSDVDRGSPGMQKGLFCRPLSPEELLVDSKEGRTLDVTSTFKVRLDGVYVAVDRKQFDEFLSRNPHFDRGCSPKPEDIFCKLWRERTPSPLPVSPPLLPIDREPCFRYSLWEKMAILDSSEPNIFFFIEKHSKTFSLDSLRPGGAHYPFVYLKRVLSSCSSLLPPEDRARLFEQRLCHHMRSEPAVLAVLGLHDASVIKKIVRDLVEFLSPRVLFLGVFDEPLKNQLRPDIMRIVSECKTAPAGKVSRTLLSSHPDKLLVCKKIFLNKYEVSLVDFHPLPKEKQQNIVHALSDLQMSSVDIDLILLGLASRWYNFYMPVTTSSAVLRQTHQIKGVKIFTHRSGELVADIAIASLSGGQNKEAKRKYTLFPEGTLIENIRYKARKDDYRRESFSLDIAQELAMRERLGKIPYFLDMYESGKYFNKDGILRTRYEAKEYCGTVEGLIFSKTGEPIPDHQRNMLRALRIVHKALIALTAIHAKGVVHKDVKLANILCSDGDEGVLADLGFATSVESPHASSGTPEYAAPECIWPKPGQKNDPRSDVFAFGVLLLFIYRPHLRADFDRLQRGAFHFDETMPQSIGSYKESLEHFRNSLRTTDFGNFIADLLHPECEQRISSQQALARFSALLPSLEQDPMITQPLPQ